MSELDRIEEETDIRIHDLKKAIDRVRQAHADRADVVVDLKNAKFNRLELLVEALEPVINDIPSDIEIFEFAVTNGETPRLWVDMTSFVRMGADGHEYEFVKETRAGRTILGRSGDKNMIGETITNYVAERILDREREIEGDWITYQSRKKQGEAEVDPVEGEPEAEIQNEAPQTQTGGWKFALFCLVLLVMIIAAVFYFGDFQPLLSAL